MKNFAALAVFAGLSVTAHAQSSVTLFGTLDVNVRYVKNADASLKSLSNDGTTSSRLGVRGLEDLGDGLQAGFWLESGLNPDDGTTKDTTRFWSRRSTVSLLGPFGEVRLGRDQVPTYLGFSDYDALGTNGVGTGDKFITKLGTVSDTGKRADNQISYLTPSALGGFYGRVSVAPSEGTAGKKYLGGRVGYAAGPLNVSLAYGQTTVGVNPAGGDKFEVFDAGASYDLGVVKLTGYYTQSSAGALKLAVFNVGALVPVAQAGVVRVSYINANASGSALTDPNDANQFAAGYLHNLSKRSALYATVAHVNNKGAAAFNVATPSVLPKLPAGQSSTGYEIGIRHSF